MERRELLKMIVATTGVAFVGSAFSYDLTTGTALKNTGFSAADIKLMNEIGEVIMPKTDTPGAKDADVASSMAVIVNDCYTPEEQTVFRAGLGQINVAANSEYGSDFMSLSSAQKLALLNKIDAEAKSESPPAEVGGLMPHYFSMMKQLVLFCFFTSEIGATKVLRFVAIPGRYDGEYPYKKGDKAWAT